MLSYFKDTARLRSAGALVALTGLALLWWGRHSSTFRLQDGEMDERALVHAPSARATVPHVDPVHDVPAKAQSAGSVPADKAPFDVSAVIEKVRSAFETTEDGFRGGRAEYSVRASADGIALTARRWEPESRSSAKSKASDKTSTGHHDHSPRQEPLESPELVLRTAHVGRGVAEASGALGEDENPVLEDGARLVAWQRDNHTEHLRQTPEGVEQTWEFPTKPEGRDDLVVRVDVSGLKYVKETANGLHFADAGGLGFRYGHGTWIDASGVKTAISAHYSDGAIELLVPSDVVERSAYPAVLDPVMGPEFGLQGVLTPRGSQSSPSIASNGVDYLVVWSEAHAPGKAGDIYAARVSAAGVMLDEQGLALSETQDGESVPSVASDGGDYLVVWQVADSESEWAIRANRVTAAGDVLDGSGFPVATGPSGYPRPQVASNGGGYLVTWTDSRSGSSDVYATRVDASGTVLDGNGFGVSTGPREEIAGSVASNGKDYLLAWTDFRSRSTDIYFSRVSSAGEVLDPTGVPLATGEANEDGPSVASNGTSYLIAWNVPGDGGGTHVSRVNPEGLVLDGGVLVVPNPYHHLFLGTYVASNGTDFLVLVQQGATGLYGRRVSGSGVPMDASYYKVASSADGGGVASNGSDYLVAHTLRETVPTTVFHTSATPVSSAGAVGKQLAVVPQETNAQFAPRVASNGTSFLVLWMDHRNSRYGLYASRVSAAGEALDEPGLLIVDGYPDEFDVASNGTGYLVAWRFYYEPDWLYESCNVSMRSVSVSGEPGDTQSIPGQDPHAPHVASNGSGYLVVWEENDHGIRATRTSETGKPMGPAVAVTSNYRDEWPRVASNGSDYLVVWPRELDVFARRVSAKGELQGAEFPVSTADGEQASPAVASNGGDYLVAWKDERSGVDADIYASRVTANGIVQDPSGFAISTAPGDQGGPGIAKNGRDYLVYWVEKRNDRWQDFGVRLTLGPRAVSSEFLLDESGLVTSIVGRGDRYLVASNGAEPGVSKIALRFMTEDCDLDPKGDDDRDAICGSSDNCPDVANFGQEDSDGDGRGDACDGCTEEAERGEDADGDGTADCADQCPSDPEKITDFDLDVDGTLNCNDGCPTNPKKTKPGVCGCNVSDADTDGDGTPDCVDPCPDDERDACVDPGEGGVGGAGGARNDEPPGSGGGADDASSGCSCRIVVAPSGSGSIALLVLTGIGLVVARRRLRAA